MHNIQRILAFIDFAQYVISESVGKINAYYQIMARSVGINMVGYYLCELLYLIKILIGTYELDGKGNLFAGYFNIIDAVNAAVVEICDF